MPRDWGHRRILLNKIHQLILRIYTNAIANPKFFLQFYHLQTTRYPWATYFILQEVNCLILKEYNKTIVTDLEKAFKSPFQGLFFCLLILVV